MPPWARFLTAVASGGGLGLAFALLVAASWHGGLDFWRGLWQYAAKGAFWWTAARFCLLSAGALLLGRAAGATDVRAGGRGGRTGLYAAAAGAVLALIWATFLAGSLRLSMTAALKEALVLAVAGGLGGAAATWLYARL